MRMTAMVLAFVVGGIAIPAEAALQIGKAPPDFTLPSKRGRNVRLSELRGQVVLINFWASWCGPCREELPVLDKLQTQYRPAGFTLLAVNIDTVRADADQMLRKLGVKVEPLYDVNHAAARSYEIATMPFTVIVDRDGRVRHTHLGYQSGADKKYEQEIRELLKQ